MNIKKLLINILIRKGNIILSESYYGDSTDFERTEKAQRDLQAYIKKIDFDSSETPKSDIDCRFAGTFADCEDKQHVLKGKITLNSGAIHFWKLEIESDDFTKIIELGLNVYNESLSNDT